MNNVKRQRSIKKLFNFGILFNKWLNKHVSRTQNYQKLRNHNKILIKIVRNYVLVPV